MGTETSKIALNAHVHLRTANQQMSRPERHVDDITDMRRSCRLRENTSVRRPLGSSSRLLKVPIVGCGNKSGKSSQKRDPAVKFSRVPKIVKVHMT